MAETPPNDDRIERARRLFERATPKLRAAGEAIERSDELREALDTITDRVVELGRTVDDAMKKATAIEGTVVERAAQQPTTDTAPPPIGEPVARRRPPILRYALVMLLGAFIGATLLRRRRG